MPKGSKTKASRTLSRSFTPKPKSKIQKPDVFESNPIFQPVPNSTIGNSRYFYTGLWLAFLVGLAQGVDASHLFEKEFEYPGQDNSAENSAQTNPCENPNSQTPQISQTSDTSHTSQTSQNANPLVFSEHARSAVHPGLYMMKNQVAEKSDYSNKFFDKIKELATKKDPEAIELYIKVLSNQGLDNHNPKVSEINQEVRAALEIDQSYQESEPGDRFAHDAAIDFLEKSVLPTPIQKLKVEQLEEILGRLNLQITSPDERVSRYVKEGRTLYRKQGMEVLLGGFPGLMEGDRAIAYLEKNDPQNVETYKEFVELYNKFVDAQEQNPTRGKLTHESNFYERIAGKNKSVLALIHKYVWSSPHPDTVPKLMHEFLHNLGKKLQVASRDPIQIAAYAHMEFVYIHPFAQANGRTARALMNIILVQNNLPAVAFLSNKEYMHTVSQSIEAETRNYRVFEEFLRKKVKKASEHSTTLKSFPEKMDKCLKKCKSLCVLKCQNQLKQMVREVEEVDGNKAQQSQQHPREAHKASKRHIKRHKS